MLKHELSTLLKCDYAENAGGLDFSQYENWEKLSGFMNKDSIKE